jgi:hypothetical protein
VQRVLAQATRAAHTHCTIVARAIGWMARLTITTLVLMDLLVGCAPHTGQTAALPPPPQYATEEQRILACLDLQDHIVDLYATEYVSHERLTMSLAERTAFREGWAEELAKRGTFERFEQSCFFGVTPRKYECGMQSQTTGGLVACMKLSAR